MIILNKKRIMIILNKKKFAESPKEFTDSLFDKNETCVGHAKRFKRRIEFYDLDHHIFAMINQWGVLASTCEYEGKFLLTTDDKVNDRMKLIIPEFKSETEKYSEIEKLAIRIMIILNKKKFAESPKEFTDSLFDKNETCVGHAKRFKRQIKLFNYQKELIGVINRYNVLCCATKIEGGYWYTLADIDLIGRYTSYITESAELEKLAISRTWDGKDYVYSYK
jgi:hypothetical protein